MVYFPAWFVAALYSRLEVAGRPSDSLTNVACTQMPAIGLLVAALTTVPLIEPSSPVTDA